MAKKILPHGDLKNIMPTAAIRMGDEHVLHSCGECEIDVPLRSGSIANRFCVMDTAAFDFVLGTDFFVEHCQILSLRLQARYVLQVDHGRKATQRAGTPVNRSQVAQDTPHAKQRPESAHR